MAVEENAIFLKFKGDIQETFTGRTAYSKDGPNLINTAPISAKFDTSTTVYIFVCIDVWMYIYIYMYIHI
jgi:hypothetical protein